jgi:hypothetical protein
MAELTISLLHPMLIGLGVPPESVSALLDPYLVQVRRSSLRAFGGSRLKTLQTEMRSFQWEYRNPSIRYLLFKYFIVCAATLLLPPRRFYQLRDWYAQEGLGRYRDWLCKTGVRAPNGPPPRVRLS